MVLDFLRTTAEIRFTSSALWCPTQAMSKEKRLQAIAAGASDATSCDSGGGASSEKLDHATGDHPDHHHHHDQDDPHHVPTFFLHAPTVLAFVEAVRRRYRRCPFHNFQHGLHVCQASALLLRQMDAAEVLSPMERAATVLCALSHDVDHPGINNSFLQTIEAPVALRYNDVSILENHHTMTTFEIIRTPGTDCFGVLDRTEYLRCRALMVRAILATDMSGHFDMTKELKAMTAPFEAGAPDKTRNRLAEVVVHSADVSGQVLEWDLAQIWSDRVISEFKAQQERETDLGLDTAPFMLGLEKESRRMGLQKGFCGYVLTALWQPLADLYPTLAPQMDNLSKNAARYTELEAQAKSSEEAAELAKAEEHE